MAVKSKVRVCMAGAGSMANNVHFFVLCIPTSTETLKEYRGRDLGPDAPAPVPPPLKPRVLDLPLSSRTRRR